MPESGVDAVRNVAIDGKRIAAISTQRLRGKVEVDATVLVVAPGFIDLYPHSHNPEAQRLKAIDGVTTVFELGVGVSPVSDCYAAHEGKSLINFGANSDIFRRA
jgi:N-acyl-D-aspartate/D-glutamate deacylase